MDGPSVKSNASQQGENIMPNWKISPCQLSIFQDSKKKLQYLRIIKNTGQEIFINDKVIMKKIDQILEEF